mgnify:CR=1 FL=1
MKLKLATRQGMLIRQGKGVMQVLCGRGLIDGKTLPYYDNTVNLGQDAHEIVNLDSSLRHIMSMRTSFLKDRAWSYLP